MSNFITQAQPRDHTIIPSKYAYAVAVSSAEIRRRVGVLIVTTGVPAVWWYRSSLYRLLIKHGEYKTTGTQFKRQQKGDRYGRCQSGIVADALFKGMSPYGC